MKYLGGEKYEQYVKFQKYKLRKKLSKIKNTSGIILLNKTVDIFSTDFKEKSKKILQQNNTPAKFQINCKYIKKIMPCDILFIRQCLIENADNLKKVIFPRNEILNEFFHLIEFGADKSVIKTAKELPSIDRKQKLQNWI